MGESEEPANRSLIRPAAWADLEAVRRIFNTAIRATTAVLIDEEVGEEWAEAWFASHGPRRPALVAECDGETAGWVSVSDFSSRCGYRYTGEISLYVDERFRRRGLGRRLVEEAEREAAAVGLHSLMALIEAENYPSIRLFESLGYQRVGLLREVGYKFGAWRSVAYYQKFLEPLGHCSFAGRLT